MSNNILLPEKLTAENGAKALLIGEFKNEDGSYVSWSTIKQIYQKIVSNQELLIQQ